MQELQLNISNREYEILELISLGHTTNDIANELFVSTETIKTHRYNLLKKLRAKNVAHLIRLAGDKNLFNRFNKFKIITHKMGN